MGPSTGRSGDAALVVVDHGSRHEAANASLEKVARDIAAQAEGRWLAVLPAHMELASPTFDEAFDAAVAAGATRIVIALYFLAPGRHSEIDVPRIAAQAARRHPGVEFAITECLGPHAAISALVLERAEAVLSSRRD